MFRLSFHTGNDKRNDSRKFFVNFPVGLEGKKAENDVISKMIIYKVFCMDYGLKKRELL